MNEQSPHVAFLISSYNRRPVLLPTLARLEIVSRECGIPNETMVIDNASTDGSADAVAASYPNVRLFREATNRGACSKNVALAQTRARYVVFLDDDSSPDSASIAQMVRYFEADPMLGAAIFNVTLPDGSRECSAYPDVFIGCGTGFRRLALDQVGGLPEDFFMQAEEYDLSLRLLDGGWEISRFNDLHVSHLKTPAARIPARTMRLDVRNNLTVIARRFPRRWVLPFAIDWMRRYWWIAASKGAAHRAAFVRGIIEGAVRGTATWRRQPVTDETFERFARIEQIFNRLSNFAAANKSLRIILLDVGKNILPFYLAARRCGITIVAIADDKLAGRTYRGIPVVRDEAARRMSYEAAVVANVSPVHSATRRNAWRRLDRRPVIDVLEPLGTQRLAA